MLEGITSADNAVSSVYMLQEAPWIQYSRGTPEMLIVQTKLNGQGRQPAARFLWQSTQHPLPGQIRIMKVYCIRYGYLQQAVCHVQPLYNQVHTVHVQYIKLPLGLRILYRMYTEYTNYSVETSW